MHGRDVAERSTITLESTPRMMNIHSVSSQSIFSKIVLAIALWGAIGGCDAPDWLSKFRENQRAKKCEEIGATGEQLEACKNTEEGYRYTVESMKQRRQAQKAEAFNTALKAFMPRPILKSNYEAIALEVLNLEYQCCSPDDANTTKGAKPPLLGKRLKVRGELRYHPTDYKSGIESFVSLEKETDQNMHWYLDVDIESLGREERAFVRANCLDDCAGEFFGTIGPIEKAKREILGLQIEYMELSDESARASSAIKP